MNKTTNKTTTKSTNRSANKSNRKVNSKKRKRTKSLNRARNILKGIFLCLLIVVFAILVNSMFLFEIKDISLVITPKWLIQNTNNSYDKKEAFDFSEFKKAINELTNVDELILQAFHNNSNTKNDVEITYGVDAANIPEYSGSAFVTINDNIPDFTEEEKTSTEPFENYSKLDKFGRCGVAYANICEELIPTKDRGTIGDVRPSGFDLYDSGGNKIKCNNNKYPELIEGNYIYNRCHLIAYCLAGENANKLNLITGTRYLNIDGMLPFETKVYDYMKANPDNHVLYKVTPVFENDDLVARGVLMEAYSVEDKGEGISFNVFAYNVQPGIEINYANGENTR